MISVLLFPLLATVGERRRATAEPVAPAAAESAEY
jgi:hypothetical protein